MTEELKLDRNFLHSQFSSWRLQRLAVVNRYQLCATGHASGVATTALDFLHTRASVLRNHLLLSEDRLFIYTQSEHSPGYFVYELLPVPSSDQGLLASQVAELGSDAGEEAAGGAIEALVDCSLAVVSEPLVSQAAAGGPGPDADTAAAADALHHHDHPNCSHHQLLLSRGHGDIVLMRRRGNHVSYSNVVHPLRPQPPYTGVRPLILEAAFAKENGDITAVVWAMRSKGPHLAACCEVFAVTLRPREGGEGAPAAEAADPEEPMAEAAPGRIHLTTVGVRLLLRTKLPPFLVRVLTPETVAAEAQQPSGSTPAAASTAAAAAAAAAGDHHRVVLLGFDPSTAGLEEELEEGAPAVPVQPDVAPGGADRPGRGGGGGGGAADDDDDDMDPRTLEQAAARLAHMTSEEREGAQPPPQWADLYKESGPDGVGAMGGEPAIDVAAWRLPAGAEDDASGSSGVGQLVGKALAPFWRLCCGAHRLLTAEEAVGPLRHSSRHHRRSSQSSDYQPLPSHPLLLLGLTDDVDCAVVRLDGWRGTRQKFAEEGSGAGPAGQPAAAQPGALDGPPQPCRVRHVCSIPALAYVAAGKTYKRHLLLSNNAAGLPAHSSGSGRVQTGVAAVLVENQRFMYLYGITPTGEEYGKQQVVDLGLEEGETVLGARLVEVAAEAEAEAEGQGGASTVAAMVVVATQRRLLSYRLRM